MELEWDEDKRQKALRERGLDFADVVSFEFETASTVMDNRIEYGERRLVSTGYLNGRLCVLCWTMRAGTIRVISLRKANEREQKTYSNTAG
jgi:uncharacterized protein